MKKYILLAVGFVGFAGSVIAMEESVKKLQITNNREKAIIKALEAAVENGQKEIIEHLIKSGADVNAKIDRYDTTLLMTAVDHNQKEIVELLIKNKADVNAQRTKRGGGNALAWASEEGNDKIVEILVKAGADVNAEATSSSGDTPLILAVRHSNRAVAKRLFEAGANPLTKNKKGKSAVSLLLDSMEEAK